MLVAAWNRILAVLSYSYMIHGLSHLLYFTGDAKFMIRSLMNTKERVGGLNPTCGTHSLMSILLLFVQSILTGRLCRYDLIHRNIYHRNINGYIMQCFILLANSKQLSTHVDIYVK